MHPQQQTPLPPYVRRNYPLSRLTRFRSGGRCDCYAPVATLDALREAVALAGQRQLPVCVIGKGSNILAHDADFTGMVIDLQDTLKTVTIHAETRTVTAGAGASLMALGRLLAGQGYAGFTYMGVIPGTVGGALRMNAGISAADEIKKDFLRATVLDPHTGQTVTLNAASLQFGYRTSALAASPLIVLDATFRLPQAHEPCPGRAMAELRRLFAERRARQPACPYTFGSTFRNPPGAPHSAGWYLERAGMRGVRIGGAMVAREHANWIINADHARSGHARELIELGRKRVYETFGISLVREVVYLPDDLPLPQARP
jgi:UDP-N-acetylmuramate dehydrogenase